MSLEKTLMKTQAKKLYHKLIKENKTPKRSRMPFSAFFKQYCIAQKAQPQNPAQQEDFDFADMVNTNDLNTAGLEPIEVAEDEGEVVADVREGGSGAVVGIVENGGTTSSNGIMDVGEFGQIQAKADDSVAGEVVGRIDLLDAVSGVSEAEIEDGKV